MNQINLEPQTYCFAGTHFFASYLDCDQSNLINVTQLKNVMNQAVVASGATILGSSEYIFEGNGYTSAIILSESHATIHTYPEVGKCFVDLFTCGNKCSYERFDEVLRHYLQPSKVSFDVVKRNDSHVMN